MKAGIAVHPQIFYLPLNDSTNMYCSQGIWCWVRRPREGNGTSLQYSCLENPMDGGAWWAAVHGVAKSDMTEWLHFHFSLSCIGEGNGNPLQCSCLENPKDGGAWWAAIYGVAQSRTWLKWLSSSKKAQTSGICQSRSKATGADREGAQVNSKNLSKKAYIIYLLL